MKTSIATITLTGLTPYSQSRQHDDPMLEGEGRDAYDARTWRSKQNVAIRDGKPTVVIPAHGFHQAMIAAAKYSKRQIPGQGKATWTKKFEAGISCRKLSGRCSVVYSITAVETMSVWCGACLLPPKTI